MGKLTHNPPGTPLPEGHPFKGGTIILGMKRPDLSVKDSTTPESSAKGMPAAARALESAVQKMLRGAEAEGSPVSIPLAEHKLFESNLEELRQVIEFNEEADRRRLLAVIPSLLESADFRKDLEANLGDRAPKIISDIESGKETEGENRDLLFDAANAAFRSNAHNVLSLGWDGGFPGMSGAAWVSELEGVFFVTSSDYEAEGPFDTLDEALTCECFGTVTESPELDSETLPLEQLLEIAHGVVDWENEGDIWINSRRFVTQGEELVEETPE